MNRNLISIYSALAANVLIATTKFVAGAFSNSSSMVSEGIHSLVDGLNELLLLYGIYRSKKPADKQRPFGYGKELYFWSFIVSILIFAVGGGLTIYQGIIHIIDPEPLKNPMWNYIVLGISGVLDGISLVISVRAFNKSCNGLRFWDAIIQSKDPSNFIVLFEDGADVVGLIIVAVLMSINYKYNLPVLDGVASILIGVVLIFASFILARESRSLLMGEGMAPENEVKIRRLAEDDVSVNKVLNFWASYQSPKEILLVLIIEFKAEQTTSEMTDAIERLKKGIKDQFDLVEFIIIQPQSLAEHTNKEVQL